MAAPERLEPGDPAVGEFHPAIARTAGQPVLERFLAELVAHSSLLVLYGHRGRSDCGDRDHLAIAAAMRERDGRSG